MSFVLEDLTTPQDPLSRDLDPLLGKPLEVLISSSRRLFTHLPSKSCFLFEADVSISLHFEVLLSSTRTCTRWHDVGDLPPQRFCIQVVALGMFLGYWLGALERQVVLHGYEPSAAPSKLE